MRRFKNQPDGPTVDLHFVIPAGTKKQLEREAINQSVATGNITTTSDVVRDAITIYLESKKLEATRS